MSCGTPHTHTHVGHGPFLNHAVQQLRDQSWTKQPCQHWHLHLHHLGEAKEIILVVLGASVASPPALNPQFDIPV